MARKVDYFAMKIPNRAGEAARLLKAMGKAGVNLLAFTGFPTGRGAQIDFVPASTQKFLKVAKKLRLRVGKKKAGFWCTAPTAPARSPPCSVGSPRRAST